MPPYLTERKGELIMATPKKAKKEKKYIVTVKNNPEFCGKGAGGVQVAKGKAENVTARMAAWFKEHPGYDVKEVEVEVEDETDTGAAEGAE